MESSKGIQITFEGIRKEICKGMQASLNFLRDQVLNYAGMYDSQKPSVAFGS